MSTLRTIIRRGAGALLFAGPVAGLIGLASAGVAGATPVSPRIPAIPPGNPVITHYIDPGVAVELNPQPLPPRQWAPGIDSALNPQPLPPGPPDPDLWFRAELLGF